MRRRRPVRSQRKEFKHSIKRAEGKNKDSASHETPKAAHIGHFFEPSVPAGTVYSFFSPAPLCATIKLVDTLFSSSTGVYFLTIARKRVFFGVGQRVFVLLRAAAAATVVALVGDVIRILEIATAPPSVRYMLAYVCAIRGPLAHIMSQDYALDHVNFYAPLNFVFFILRTPLLATESKSGYLKK